MGKSLNLKLKKSLKLVTQLKSYNADVVDVMVVMMLYRTNNHRDRLFGLQDSIKS